MVAPIIVGTARKKLNSAAVRRSTPSDSAPNMVAPERLTPGIIDRHWIMPTPTALPSEMSATPFSRALRRGPLDHQDGDAAEQQRPGDDGGAAEHCLDPVDEQEAQYRRGQEGDQYVAHEAPAFRLFRKRPVSTAQKVRQ